MASPCHGKVGGSQEDAGSPWHLQLHVAPSLPQRSRREREREREGSCGRGLLPRRRRAVGWRLSTGYKVQHGAGAATSSALGTRSAGTKALSSWPRIPPTPEGKVLLGARGGDMGAAETAAPAPTLQCLRLSQGRPSPTRGRPPASLEDGASGGLRTWRAEGEARSPR